MTTPSIRFSTPSRRSIEASDRSDCSCRSIIFSQIHATIPTSAGRVADAKLQYPFSPSKPLPSMDSRTAISDNLQMHLVRYRTSSNLEGIEIDLSEIHSRNAESSIEESLKRDSNITMERAFEIVPGTLRRTCHEARRFRG
jgi:hypothetical protein